jgi:hypothetical protein
MNKTNTITETIREVIYKENRDRESRAKSVIISGLPEYSDDDLPQVFDLLRSEFDFEPANIHCKRVGSQRGDKPRLLQVSFQGSEEAAWLIAMAPKLRKARDTNVRASIYINKNLSYQERADAYEKRRKRRGEMTRTAGNIGDLTGDGESGVSRSNLSRTFTNSQRHGGAGPVVSSASGPDNIMDATAFPPLVPRTADRGSGSIVHGSLNEQLHRTCTRPLDLVSDQRAGDYLDGVSKLSGVHPIDRTTGINLIDHQSGVHPVDHATGVHRVNDTSGVHPDDPDDHQHADVHLCDPNGMADVPSRLSAGLPFAFGLAGSLPVAIGSGRPITGE